MAIIDGSGILYRVQKSLVKDGIVDFDLMIVGFIGYIFPFLLSHPFTKIIICFDLKGTVSRYRKRMYPEYKAFRHGTETPEEKKAHKATLAFLMDQLPLLGFPVVCLSEVEADDVGYFLASRNAEGVLYSRDNDWKLNLFPGWKLFVPISNKIITYEDFNNEWGPSDPTTWFLYYKSLVGDTADGVKGVLGIGEKKAKQFIEETKAGIKSKHSDRITEYYDIVERNMMLLSPKWIHSHSETRDEVYEQEQDYVIPADPGQAFQSFCRRIGTYGSSLLLKTFEYEAIIKGVK